MAMDANRMAQAVVDALDADGAYDDALDKPAAKADSLSKWELICTSILGEITSNAEVSTTVASGIPVSTTGTASAQTGSTTSDGTGSGGIS